MTLPLTNSNNQNKSNEVILSPAVLELLASRICHDLISPVGAVHNGVEFLQEMGADAGEEAVNLITHSAQQASAKLQAFRLAYGAGGRDPNIKPEDVHKTFENLILGYEKITHDWDPHGNIGFEDRPAGYCKTLMGTLMLAQECLPKGGKITVEAGKTDSETLVIAKGQDAAPRPQIIQALDHSLSTDAMDPRLVHPYALSAIAKHYGLLITVAEQDTGTVTLSIKKA
jgi:histidine phosphotransferase ChpT